MFEKLEIRGKNEIPTYFRRYIYRKDIPYLEEDLLRGSG